MSGELTQEEFDRLVKDFTYHAPQEGQSVRYEDIRGIAMRFAEKILMECPDSRERSLAMTRVEEAVFWANASIARNE